MAAPMPRPAPVTTATCPAKAGAVSLRAVSIRYKHSPASRFQTATERVGNNIHHAHSMHLNNCILTIKGRVIGKSLAFGNRGTYNPANREKGSGGFAFHSVTPCPPGPCPEARHSRAGSERRAVQAVGSRCLGFRENDSQKSHFPKVRTRSLT